MDVYISGVTFEPSVRRPTATCTPPHTFARAAHSRYVRAVHAQIFFTLRTRIVRRARRRGGAREARDRGDVG